MRKVEELIINGRALVKTKTVYQSFITSGSTIVNGLLGVVFYILAARYLGPTNFGILTVALTTLSLVSDIATVGTDTGVVKFVGQHFNSDRKKALQFLKLGLEVKVIVGAIVLILGISITPFISTVLLGKPELTNPLRLAILGAFISLLFTFSTSALQSVQKFWTWGVVNISANVLRLAAIGGLIITNNLTINSTLITYISCVLLGFFVALTFLPEFMKAKDEFSLSREFFHYNKWVAAFVLIAAFSSRLDTYLTTKLLPLSAVGIYGVATSLSVVGSQLVAGITTVVAPKLAGFNTRAKAKVYLKKLQVFVLVLAAIEIVVGVPLSIVIVPLFYGSAYLGSIAPLVVLIVAQAIFLISVPAHSSVIYYFSYPKLFVYISLVHMFIIGALGYILISRIGYMGAAATVLVGNISNLLIPGIWVLRKFKLEERS